MEQTSAPSFPTIKSLLKELTGRDHDECIRTGVCTFCGGEAKEFRNNLSRRENGISGFCQNCQDEVFGKD